MEVSSVTRRPEGARSVSSNPNPKLKSKKAGGAKANRIAEAPTHTKSKGVNAQSAKTSSETPTLFRTDQLGATLAKGLDLAEAGLSLGLTIVNRVGSMVQNTVLEKLSENLSPQPPSPSPGHRQEERDESPASSATAPEPPQGNDVGYCIMNRLPVRPGQALLVSFSINNDSEGITKRVKLQVEGFVGQISAVHFPEHAFSVKPATSTIAPMDFEKFVLKGALPPDIPSDVYLGKVVVVSDHALEIPVKLIVGPAST
jgi:hypothetical protein